MTENWTASAIAWASFWLVACVVAVSWHFYGSRSEALDRADTLAAAIPALRAQRDEAEAMAAAYEQAAARADSVAQAAQDSAAARTARARARIIVVTDTLETLVTDTTARRLMAQKDSAWSNIVATKDSVIVELAASRDLWRASSSAKDSVIALWVRQDSVRAGVESALRDHIRGQTRRMWAERVVVVAVGACVLLCR